jgi:hypothetical protein
MVSTFEDDRIVGGVGAAVNDELVGLLDEVEVFLGGGVLLRPGVLLADVQAFRRSAICPGHSDRRR